MSSDAFTYGRQFLESLIEPDVWLAVESRRPGKDSDWYVNGYKVLNSTDPLRRWVRSRKPTPSWLNKSRGRFLVPHTTEAAARLLRNMHAALVLLDHQNPHRWPCPFGVVWMRFGDGMLEGSYCKQSLLGQWGWTISKEGEERGKSYFAFLGDNFYQDGAKFRHAAEQAMPLVNGRFKAPVIVAVKDVWLKELAERLNAFPQFKRDEENKRASYL